MKKVFVRQVAIVFIAGLLTAMVVSSCGPDASTTDPTLKPSPTPTARPSVIRGQLDFKTALKTFEDCDAIQKDIHHRIENERQAALEYFADDTNNDYHGIQFADPIASPDVDDAATSSDVDDVLTNLQEAGVDEGDFVKVGESQVYLLKNNAIKVFKRDTLEYLGTLELEAQWNTIQLFVDASRLVAVYQDVFIEGGLYYESSGEDVEVSVFEIRGGSELPQKEKSYQYRGRLFDARMSEGKLVLALRDQLDVVSEFSLFTSKNVKEVTPESPVANVKADKISGIPCDKIYESPVDDMDFGLTKVLVRDVRDLTKAEDVVGLLGSANLFYMNQDSIVIAKNEPYYGTFSLWALADSGMAPVLPTGVDMAMKSPDMSFQPKPPTDKAAITTIDLALGKIGDVAYGLIEGNVPDRWAFKAFRRDTTQYLAAVSGSRTPEWTNHLSVLKNDGKGRLEITSKFSGYGDNESIQAARFIGEYAYVVTFRKMDPVYAFNLSDPENILLEDELEIPGFSSYLHPAADNRMIGVGYTSGSWDGGLQVSLFDISNPKTITRLDVEESESASSHAQWDSHAFFYDADTGFLILPVVTEEFETSSDADGNYTETNTMFVGANLYGVENDLTFVTELSHHDLMPEFCEAEYWWLREALSITRTFKVDQKLLTVSDLGLQYHDLAHPEIVLDSVSAISDESECYDDNFDGELIL